MSVSGVSSGAQALNQAQAAQDAAAAQRRQADAAADQAKRDAAADDRRKADAAAEQQSQSPDRGQLVDTTA